MIQQTVGARIKSVRHYEICSTRLFRVVVIQECPPYALPVFEPVICVLHCNRVSCCRVGIAIMSHHPFYYIRFVFEAPSVFIGHAHRMRRLCVEDPIYLS